MPFTEDTLAIAGRYLQITHDHPAYPTVLRAIDGAAEGADAEAIAARPTAFWAMVELGAALDHGTLEGRVIGQASIPADARRFPTFRLPVRNPAGVLLYWWLWDGQGLRLAGQDVDEELPLREIIDAATLKARLEAL
jgi:hypothetical protein